MKKILIAANKPAAIETLKVLFQTNDSVKVVQEPENCLKIFKQARFELLFIDLEFLQFDAEHEDYKSQFQEFWRIFSGTEIIVLADSSKIRDAVSAVKAGASNYLTFPLNPTEVKYVIESMEEYNRMHSELNYLRDHFWRSDSLTLLRTNSPLMKAVFEKVKAVSPADTTVLLTGETGTGKGIISRLLHQHSRRSEHQFISVHCGAIPEALLESELFGHEKGAFTGAIRRKLGKFEIAHGGTIFLDEVGTISTSIQIKLLQILQDKIFQRLGGEMMLTSDVRVITATNADLKSMCRDGTFRQDLYYRLNVFPIELPPLRNRVDDIPLLVEVFIKRLNKFYSKNILGTQPEVMQALQSYSWPGNIRELENVIERAYILEGTSLISPQSIPLELFEEKIQTVGDFIDISLPLEEVRRQVTERIEQQYLSRLLRHTNGKIKRSAEKAGVGVRQLHKLLTKYGIHKENFKSQLNQPE